MSDKTASASERLLGFIRSLHPVTRVIVAAGLIYLFGDIFTGLAVLSRYQQAGAPLFGAPLDTIAAVAHAVGYSLGFFGTAASVEYLFRIWREVVLMRQRGEVGDQ